MHIDDLRVSLVQTELIWQSPKANRELLSQKMGALAGTTDLIVLPEMFTTGFMMQPEMHSEPMEADTLAWMREQASLLNAALCGSIAMQVEKGFVNRFLLVEPSGEVSFYDKRHLFRMGDEHNHYAAGDKRVIFNYRGWRILPTVCYDLRFPVFMRSRNDYDLAICVANWPAARRHPWRALLVARAIENQCYMLGVNRIGEDAAELQYSGDSMAIDFKGEALIDRDAYVPFIETVNLSHQALTDFKVKFPAWQDADHFELSF